MKSCLAFVLVLLAASTAAKDCAISGLPGKTSPDASVTTIRVNNVTSLSLSCRCSLHSPMWNVMRLEDWQTEPVTGPIGCEDNGGPCTPVARSFIATPSPEVFTFIDHTFTIDQTMVLTCYKITGFSDSPDETAIIYFNHEEEETEVPTIATTELLTTSATTEQPSPTTTSTFLHVPSTSTDEPDMTRQTQPLATPNEPPTAMQMRPDVSTNSPDPSMPSDMTLINVIEDELGQSALYLLPIVLALVVMVIVLFGCLILLKYKRKKVSNDVEKPQQQEDTPDMTKQEIQPTSNLLDSRLRANSNTYVTLTLSPSTNQSTLLEAVPKSSDNVTELKQVRVDQLSRADQGNSELSLTIPLSLCMHGSSEILRTCETSPSVDSRTITSHSTN